MALVVDVPLNTAIADLDAALRALLRRELGRHGFEGVDVAFDAPSKDWSGKLTNPAVNLFLYDLREAAEQAAGTPTEVRDGNGGAHTKPPSMRLELAYAVTGWAKAVEDEHRLLSQVLAVLFSYRKLPVELLAEHLNPSARVSNLETRVGRPREDKSDFWSSVGGTYKASIDFIVRMTVESGATFTRGPEVRVQSMRTRLSDGPARTMSELMRFGGTVHHASGAPLVNAWVALPDAGRWTSTDADGRFLFDRVLAGRHRIVARTMRGEEAELTADIPGTNVDLVIGEPAGSGPRRRSRSGGQP
ncbi:MAG: hypothetical protein QOE86_707 [Solirubrobacteraceae bacterium]|nr:hypothetical protein [Solirubrobacteraceae bacterium]